MAKPKSTEPARILAERIKEMRSRQRRSQQDLADAVNAISGWSWLQTTIAKIESDDPKYRRKVDVQEVFVLALALGVSPIWLFLPSEQDRGRLRIGEQYLDRGVYVTWLHGGDDISGYDAVELDIARDRRAAATSGKLPDADFLLHEKTKKGER